MKKFYYCISKTLFGIVMSVATLSINATCDRRYYQEKLCDQLEKLRMFKDE